MTVSIAAAPVRIDYPDADVCRRVATYLASRHYTAFNDLHVDVHDGSVTVTGCVASFHEKQVALNACQRVAGVLSLVDQITVGLPGSGSARPTSLCEPCEVVAPAAAPVCNVAVSHAGTTSTKRAESASQRTLRRRSR